MAKCARAWANARQRASEGVLVVVELKPCSCYAIGEAIERDSAKIVDKEG